MCAIVLFFLLLQGDGNDVEWSADTSEEAVRKRMEELSTNAAGLTSTADTEQPRAVRMEGFFAFVKVWARLAVHESVMIDTLAPVGKERQGEIAERVSAGME